MEVERRRFSSMTEIDHKRVTPSAVANGEAPNSASWPPKRCVNLAYNFEVTPNGWKAFLPQFLRILVASMVFSPLVFAQTFMSTGNLNTGRNGQRSIPLKNGTVLIVGGYDRNENALASAELYDSVTGTFTATGNLNVARHNFGITLLNDGRVLVTGGYDRKFNALASAEIYDPATGVFTLTGNLKMARGDATATRLRDGTVLIAGGFATSYIALPSTEIYDPSTQSFALGRSLNAPRGLATASALMDGTVLIAGGWNGTGAVSSAEIYDIAAGSFKTTGSMNQARVRHTATVLNGGNVLIAGGEDSANNILSGAEIYSPTLRKFTPTRSLNTARGDHAATLLTNGMVLIQGGFACYPSNCVNTRTNSTTSAEEYDPISGSFLLTNDLITARQAHTATLLANGMVLVAGGFTDGNPGLRRAELFKPTSFTPANLVWITINPANPPLSVGSSQGLSAIARFSDNSTEQLASVIWASSDNTVAAVMNDSGSNSGITNDSTNSGVVSGAAKGTAILTACAGAVCGSTTVSVGLPGGTQGFSLSGSPGSLTISAGEAATFSMAVTPQNGFNQTVSLSCGALPPGARCTISSPSVALSGGDTRTGAVTITTTGLSTSNLKSTQAGTKLAALAASLAVSLSLCFLLRWGRRKTRGLLAVLLLTPVVACVGASSVRTVAPGTPRGTYTINVTGKSVRMNITAQVNLVVK